MLRYLLTSFLAALVVFAQAPEQPTQSLKGVVLKNRAPVSNDVLRLKLPKPYEAKLKNSLAVLMLEDHRAPTFYLSLEIPASPFQDPPNLPGLAEATADNLKLGTRTRSARQIAESLAELGASLNVNASYGSPYTRVTLSALTDQLDAVLELFADVLLNPAFPPDEFDKYRQREIAALEQARTQPQFLANEQMYRLLYPNDARAITASSPDSLKKITPEDMRKFYLAHYHPAGARLGVAGDVNPRQLTAKLEKLLSSWKPGERSAVNLPLDSPIASRKVVLIHRPNSVQSYIMVANRAIGRLDPDYIATTVMNRVLGQGPAARLFRNIREDKGYTYGIYSALMATRHLNHFSVATSVRTDVTIPALDEILREFADIRERAVPADELAGARRAMVASFALRLEDPADTLQQLTLLKEYNLPANYWESYPEKVMGVTAEDAQRVARKYVPYENAQIVVVGDAPKLREALRKYGEVEEVGGK
jgi:predicted Zn-dependent peptidase